MRIKTCWMLLAALLLLAACGTPTPSATSPIEDTSLAFSETPIAADSTAPVDVQPIETPGAAEPPAADAADTSKVDKYSAAPAMQIDQNKSYIATIETTKGTIKA